MNVVIIGGTSQVAAELSLLFRARGHEVHPTVRSRVGASFYEFHDIEYRVVDITDTAEANDALQDADLIAIAAFARQYARGFAPKQARATNERIIQSTVEAAPADATVVYFSSIAAFGPDTGFSRWDSYGREKRNAEGALSDALQKHAKDGYAFRMGPVHGVNQDKTRQIRGRLERHLESHSELVVDVPPTRDSNVLHTVTLVDALTTVHSRSFDEDVFTLVNEPRWTWSDVLKHYTPDGVSIRHSPSQSEGAGRRLLGPIKNLLESYERPLRGLSVYLPTRVNQRVFNEYVRRDVADEITDLESDKILRLSQFNEESAPGPTIDGLRRTEELLFQEEEIQSAFSTKVKL